jgi:DNA-binding NarL/FixJ family response regulator
MLGRLTVRCQTGPLPQRALGAGSDGIVPATRPLRRLLVVEDDHRLLELLDRSLRPPGWQPVLATTGAEALAHLRADDAIAVGLVDLGLPDVDGIALVKHLATAYPALPVVILTVCTDARRILEAFRAGARGYLFKEDLATMLAPALDEALAGGAPMSRAVARVLLAQVRGDGRPVPVAPPGEPSPDLTTRERQVIEQLARGLSYDDVARILVISPNTVRSHVRAIYEKLAVSSKTEAVLAALRLGLVSNIS